MRICAYNDGVMLQYILPSAGEYTLPCGWRIYPTLQQENIPYPASMFATPTVPRQFSTLSPVIPRRLPLLTCAAVGDSVPVLGAGRRYSSHAAPVVEAMARRFLGCN